MFIAIVVVGIGVVVDFVEVELVEVVELVVEVVLVDVLVEVLVVDVLVEVLEVVEVEVVGFKVVDFIMQTH